MTAKHVYCMQKLFVYSAGLPVGLTKSNTLSMHIKYG